MGKRIETCSGVYRIKDLVSGKVYYGSALDINGRIKEHFRNLRQGIHENEHLQNAFNRDGEENFEVTTVLQLNPDGLKYEDINILIRMFEQSCIDYFECCDREKGFNKNNIASGAGIFFSRETLINRHCAINEVQFDTIVEMLQDSHNSYRKIADEVGVKREYIKQIAQKRILVKLTEKYNFPERYNQSNEDKKKYKEFIIEKRKQGWSFKQISEELGISESRVEKAYHYKESENVGVAKKVNQFNQQGEYLRSFSSVREARRFVCIKSDYIIRACNRDVGWGFCAGYLWSYEDSIPKMTLLEKLIGAKVIPSTPKSIISYDSITNLPVKFYKESKIAGQELNIDGALIRTEAYYNRQERSHKKDIYFRYADEVPEEDLKYLWEQKQAQNNQ